MKQFKQAGKQKERKKKNGEGKDIRTETRNSEVLFRMQRATVRLRVVLCASKDRRKEVHVGLSLVSMYLNLSCQPLEASSVLCPLSAHQLEPKAGAERPPGLHSQPRWQACGRWAPDLETDGLHHVSASQGWCSAILGFSEMLKPDSIFFHLGPLIFDLEAIL